MKCQCILISGTRAGLPCGNNARYSFKNVSVCGHHKNCKKLPSAAPIKKPNEESLSTAPVKKTNEKPPSTTPIKKTKEKPPSTTLVKKTNEKLELTFNDLPDDVIQVMCDAHLRDRNFRSLANFILTNKRNHEVCAGHLKELLKNVKYWTTSMHVYRTESFRQSREGRMLDDFFNDPSVKTISGDLIGQWFVMSIGEEVVGFCLIREKDGHKRIGHIAYRDPFLKLLLKPLSGYYVRAGHKLKKLGIEATDHGKYSILR